MNKAVQEQLIKLIQDISNTSKEGAVKIAEFIQTQTPNLYKEILSYSFYSLIISMIFFLLLSMINIDIFFNHYKKRKLYDEDISGTEIITFSLFFIFLTIFFMEAIALTKVIVAPKLYLIDYIIDLIKYTKLSI